MGSRKYHRHRLSETSKRRIYGCLKIGMSPRPIPVEGGLKSMIGTSQNSSACNMQYIRYNILPRVNRKLHMSRSP